MLDGEDGVAGRKEPAEDGEEDVDVARVEPGRRFVEEEERRTGAGTRLQERGDLQALRLAPRQRRGRLTEAEVAEARLGERRQARRDRRKIGEELERLVDRRPEKLVDVSSPDPHVQDLGREAAPVARVADDGDVGEELHVDRHDARALARLAATAGGVEAEAPFRQARLARGRAPGPEGAHLVPRLRVGRRVRAGGAAEGRLVDEDDVVERREPLDPVVGPALERVALLASEGSKGARGEDVDDEGRLPRPRRAADRGQDAGGNLDRQVRQVVRSRPDDAQETPRIRLGPLGHEPDPRPKRLARRRRGPRQGPRRSFEDEPAPVRPGIRAEVDDVVCRADDVEIVLDDADGVPRVGEAPEHREKACRVGRVEPDGRLVQDVERTGQGVAERRAELDPLRLAAGEGPHRPRQREVGEPDVDERPDALDEVRHERAAARPLRRAEREPPELLEELSERQRAELGQGRASDPHRPRLGCQPFPEAVRAALVPAVPRDHHADVHLVALRLEVREEPLHPVPVAVAVPDEPPLPRPSARSTARRGGFRAAGTRGRGRGRRWRRPAC